jgi:hypothetical protein
MTTPAQEAANRRNAEKSTGPNTDEGKARSSANALKHGGYATRVDAITASILGEAPDEVQALIDAIVDELDPHTPLEQMTAETVAARILNRMRVDRLTAPLAEGVAPVGGPSISPDSHFYQYQYGVLLNIALDALDGDDADADCKIDWGFLIASLRVLEPGGHGFDERQTLPDGTTRPPQTVAEWKASCALLIDRCFENRAEAREFAVFKIRFFRDLADAEARAERAKQAQQLLEHFERTTQLSDRVDRSVTKALDAYRDICANRPDTPPAEHEEDSTRNEPNLTM